MTDDQTNEQTNDDTPICAKCGKAAASIEINGVNLCDTCADELDEGPSAPPTLDLSGGDASTAESAEKAKADDAPVCAVCGLPYDAVANVDLDGTIMCVSCASRGGHLGDQAKEMIDRQDAEAAESADAKPRADEPADPLAYLDTSLRWDPAYCCSLPVVAGLSKSTAERERARLNKQVRAINKRHAKLITRRLELDLRAKELTRDANRARSDAAALGAKRPMMEGRLRLIGLHLDAMALAKAEADKADALAARRAKSEAESADLATA